MVTFETTACYSHRRCYRDYSEHRNLLRHFFKITIFQKRNFQNCSINSAGVKPRRLGLRQRKFRHAVLRGTVFHPPFMRRVASDCGCVIETKNGKHKFHQDNEVELCGKRWQEQFSARVACATTRAAQVSGPILVHWEQSGLRGRLLSPLKIKTNLCSIF